MKYGKVELGQIEAMINKLGGEKGMRQFLAGELEIVPARKKWDVKPILFVRHGTFSAVKLTERHDPKEFYQTREGLYIWGEFTGCILDAAVPVRAGRSFAKTASWHIAQVVTGEMLKLAKPEDIWSATDFCAWFSAKVKHLNGKIDKLPINTEEKMLFLVKGVDDQTFAVQVFWRPGPQEWNVRAWPLNWEWSNIHFVSKPI